MNDRSRRDKGGLKLRSTGMTRKEILADYKDLEREDVFAALAFATLAGASPRRSGA